ncbi:MAG: hypothetical protein Q4G71_10960 [Pseudomonadota bacterium]|nr:hypothetical protein [Pseudomonadota bacterium]
MHTTPLSEADRLLLARLARAMTGGTGRWLTVVVWALVAMLLLALWTAPGVRAHVWFPVLLLLAFGLGTQGFVAYLARRAERVRRDLADGHKRVLQGRLAEVRVEAGQVVYRVGDAHVAVRHVLARGGDVAAGVLIDPLSLQVRSVRAPLGHEVRVEVSARQAVLLGFDCPALAPAVARLGPMQAADWQALAARQRGDWVLLPVALAVVGVLFAALGWWALGSAREALVLAAQMTGLFALVGGLLASVLVLRHRLTRASHAWALHLEGPVAEVMDAGWKEPRQRATPHGPVPHVQAAQGRWLRVGNYLVDVTGRAGLGDVQVGTPVRVHATLGRDGLVRRVLAVEGLEA